MLKLPKVLNKNGDLIDVNHPSVERGANPDLRCPDPYCQALVIARKGKIKQPHFAHKSDEGCTGYESMLHLLAKEVLKGLDTFELPTYQLYFNDLYPYFKNEIKSFEMELNFGIPEDLYLSYEFSHGLTVWEKSAIEVFSGCKLKLMDFRLFVEKPIKDMTPDVRLQLINTDRNLHLEIFVTHKVGEEKRERIINRELCFLELDLSHHFGSGQSISREDVENILKNQKFHHTWIHFPKLEKFLNKNRQSILEEMISKVKLFYDHYVEFRNEELLPEVRNIEADPNFSEKLYKKLQKDRRKIYLCLQSSEFFSFYISTFKNSKEFQNELHRLKLESKARREDGINRWGEDIYNKIYGKW